LFYRAARRLRSVFERALLPGNNRNADKQQQHHQMLNGVIDSSS
jgi:hypothetical protein